MMRYIKTVIKYSVVVYLYTNVITSFNMIFVRKMNFLTSIYKYKYTHTSYIHIVYIYYAQFCVFGET